MFMEQCATFFLNTINSFSLLVGTTLLKRKFNILSGQEAVDYYAEVHTSTSNSILHTLFIPYASYYLYSALPQLFCLPKHQGNHMIISVNLAYFAMYFTELDSAGTVRTVLLYLPPLYFFLRDKEYTQYALLKFGMIMLFIEKLGHDILEGTESRPEGILNAILYSHYFNANHFSLY